MNDTLGDRHKLYERMTERLLMPGLPVLARIDGAAFHTFTRGLDRPYDSRLSNLMVATAKHLVDHFNAAVS